MVKGTIRIDSDLMDVVCNSHFKSNVTKGHLVPGSKYKIFNYFLCILS